MYLEVMIRNDNDDGYGYDDDGYGYDNDVDDG
jgi:hypothetical protein